MRPTLAASSRDRPAHGTQLLCMYRQPASVPLGLCKLRIFNPVQKLIFMPECCLSWRQTGAGELSGDISIITQRRLCKLIVHSTPPGPGAAAREHT